MTILKHKKVVRYKFHAGRPVAKAAPQAEGPQAMPETKRTYLGTVTTAPDETIAIDLPPDATAAEIQAAIEEAERAKQDETQRLRAIFLGGKGDSHD